MDSATFPEVGLIQHITATRALPFNDGYRGLCNVRCRSPHRPYTGRVLRLVSMAQLGRRNPSPPSPLHHQPHPRANAAHLQDPCEFGVSERHVVPSVGLTQRIYDLYGTHTSPGSGWVGFRVRFRFRVKVRLTRHA